MHDVPGADCRTLVLKEWLSHQPTIPIKYQPRHWSINCKSPLFHFCGAAKPQVFIIHPRRGNPHLHTWLLITPGLKHHHCTVESQLSGLGQRDNLEFSFLVYFGVSDCGPGGTFEMFTQLFFAAIAVLLPYLYRRTRFKRLHQFGRFPQLPPSIILGHLQTVDEFVKRSAPGAHPGKYLVPLITRLWQ